METFVASVLITLLCEPVPAPETEIKELFASPATVPSPLGEPSNVQALPSNTAKSPGAPATMVPLPPPVLKLTVLCAPNTATRLAPLPLIVSVPGACTISVL